MNRNAYKFQIDVLLQSVIVEYTSAFNFKLSMKRGSNILESKSTMKYEQSERKEVSINESFNLSATLGLKKDTLEVFQDKIYKIYLQVYTKQGFKNATFTEINFANLIGTKIENKEDYFGYNKDKIPVQLDFVKHPFGYLKLNVLVSFKFLEEIDLADINQTDLSRMSIETDYDQLSKYRINNNSNIANNTLNKKASACEQPSNNTSQNQNESSPSKEGEKNIANYVNTLNIQRNNSFFKSSNGNSFNTEPNTNNYSSQNIQVNEEISLLTENLKNQNIKIENLEKEKKEQDNIAKNLENTISTLTSQIQTLQTTNASSNTNSNPNINTTKRLAEEIKDKENIISDLKNENEYYAEENAQLKSIINDLKIEKTKNFEEKNNVIKELKQEIEKFKNKCELLEKEGNNNLKQNESTKKILEESEISKEQMKVKLIDLGNTLKNETQKYNAIIKEIKNFNKTEKDNLEFSKNKEVNELRDHYTKEITNKQIEIDKITASFGDYKNQTDLDILTYKHKINTITTSIEELQANLKSLTEENSKIKNNQNLNQIEANEEMQTTKKEIDSKESKINEKKQKIIKLKSLIEDLEEKIKYHELDKESFKDRYLSSEKKFKDDIINMRQTISQKDSDLQTLSNEKEAIRFENEKLKQELKKLEDSKSNDELFFNQINDIQNKFTDKENKLNEEKENIVRGLKKEIENLTQQVKKATMSYDKDVKIFQTENGTLKQEILYLKEESNNSREQKDKIIKLEKNLSEIQNNFAIKKVELTQSQMECEKYREELNRLENTYKNENTEKEEKIEILEKELVETKQKLGDCFNEIQEYENIINLQKEEEKKNKFSFFGKKKKDK